MMRVEARLRRLMVIGGLTLALGFVAVLAGVIYRIGWSGATAGPGATVTASIPKGSHLTSMTLGGERLALAFENLGEVTVMMVDPKTMAVVGQLHLKPE